MLRTNHPSLRLCPQFRVRVGSYPGEGEKDTASLAADTDALWSDLVAVAGTFLPGSAQDVLHDSLAPLLTTAHAREVVRAGAVELHNVASMMGGIASQEAVKLITHQVYTSVSASLLRQPATVCNITTTDINSDATHTRPRSLPRPYSPIPQTQVRSPG